MQRFARTLMSLFGWKLVGTPLPEMKHCVFIEAPHTSMWDFVWGRLGLWVLGVNKCKFFIKKEVFIFPLGPILKALGGIPVSRGNSGNHMVEQAVKGFRTKKEYSIIITPEGTRKYTQRWKKGFYHIAIQANVPIYLAYLDYAKKEGGCGIRFQPTGNYEEDLAKIQDFYKNKTAKYPEKFHLSPQYQQQKK